MNIEAVAQQKSRAALLYKMIRPEAVLLPASGRIFWKIMISKRY